MPATFCRWRIGRRLIARNGSQHAVGPVLDGVALGDELAQLGAPRAVERAQPLGEALRVVAVEAELVGQQVVEDRIRREHGQARRGGLVDDLVGRARAHVVDEDVAAREERRHLGARHRPAELGVEPELRREPLELALVRVVLAVAGRAVHLDAHAAGERGAAQDRLEPLRRRVAAEHERAQRAVVRRRVGARELGDVDPVADRAHLRATRAGTSAGRRRRPPVETLSAARTTACPFQCVYQRTSGISSGRTSGAASTA